MNRYVMCRPEHFDVVSTLNPWMDPSVPVSRPAAIEQWEGLVDLYEALGYAIDSFDPEIAAETPWAGELATLLTQAEDAGRSALSPTIKQLLTKTGPRLVADTSSDAGT